MSVYTKVEPTVLCCAVVVCLSILILYAFAFTATETPSSVWISSVNERGRTVPELALMNEPGQTSGAAAV